MHASPLLRRVLAGLGVLLAVVLLIGCYYYLRATSDHGLAGLDAPNGLDSREAERKIRLWDGARKREARGFVRFSEAEVNSYLQERLQGLRGTNTNALVAGVPHRCRVNLTANEITVHSWVDTSFLGKRMTVVWTRVVEISKTDGKWKLNVTRMSIGELEIPPSLWPRVNGVLSRGEGALQSDLRWLENVPAIELRPGDFSKRGEIRLYSYPESELRKPVRS